MSSFSVKPGSTIKASQYNELAESVSQVIPSGTQPFKNTKNGSLITGVAGDFNTRAPSKYDPLFNISYGKGRIPAGFSNYGDQFNGIWLQLADWQQPNNAVYHLYFFGLATAFFVIDFTADSPRLVWVTGDVAQNRQHPVKLPICSSSGQAGLACFQIWKTSGSEPSPYNGTTVLVAGDFSHFNPIPEQTGGLHPAPTIAPGAGWQIYLQAMAAACPFLQGFDQICLRKTVPVYDSQNPLELNDIGAPVAYTIGQQWIESIPDSCQGDWITGLSANCLSSVEFTPGEQFGAPGTPTFSYSLFNFDKYPSDIEHLSSIQGQLSAYDVVLKHKQRHPKAESGQPAYENQASAVVEYMSLEELVNAGVPVDSETDIEMSSIQHNGDNNSLQLFKFDDDDTEDFGDISSSGNYDIVLRKYSGGRELPAEVDYLQLSTLTNALNVKTDTTKTNQQYRSLEEHSQDGERYFGLYDFQTPGYSRTLKVNLSYGATTYVVQSGSGTSSPDPKVQFITRDASGNPFVSYDNIAVTAPRISTSDVDGIETIISGVVTVVSTDLSVLSGDLSDLSSQLSNYWKVGGTYDDNCYGQSIGDASKTQAIGLNSRELYAKDGSTALHWNRRVAYDGNGNPAINWSDGVYGSRCLIHRQGMPVVDWLNMALMGRANGTTVAWEDRSLKGAWTVDQGTNPGGAASLTVNGQLATTSTLKIGNTTINETQLQQLLALLSP